jgi:hypothetical protein
LLCLSAAVLTACPAADKPDPGKAYAPKSDGSAGSADNTPSSPTPGGTTTPGTKTGPAGKTGATGTANVPGPTGPSAPTFTPPAIQDGTWEHPFYLDSFPAIRDGNTATGGVAVADVYTPCAPATSEKGHEFVYMLIAPDNGTLGVSVDDQPGDALDMDVQLLDSKSKDACIARNDVGLVNTVEAGKMYYVVVDTFGLDNAKAGPFELTVTFVSSGGASSGGGCSSDMVQVAGPQGAVCMDKYEAPNKAGELPFVQYDFDESEAWCQARGKRLCYDDEWTTACAGPQGYQYVYGNTVDHSKCLTGLTWKTTNETLIGNWPHSVNKATWDHKADQFAAAAMIAPDSETFVDSIYQAEPSGTRPTCVGDAGVYDLTGSVEEWTRRRDGGTTGFHGNLKGRYWSEIRTCQGNVTVHADAFMYYEIGFRCCKDP